MAENEIFDELDIATDNDEVDEADNSSEIGRPGPAATSIVWKYGRYDALIDKTICMVSVNNQPCGAKLSGKSPSSLLKHLRTHSSVKIDEKMKAAREERKRKAPLPSGLQLSIGEGFSRMVAKSNVEPYSKSHPKQQKADKLLAIFIASTGAPKSTVEQEEFQEFLQELDPKYKAPSRKVITSKIDDIENSLKKKITLVLDETDCISAICIDLWSRKGLTASYLGITAHYFDQKSKSIRRILLGLERIDYPHTAERIVEKTNTVLIKWNLDLYSEKIFRILTDNGTNIVKAFRDFVHEVHYMRSSLEFEINDNNVEAEADNQFEDVETSLNVIIGRRKRLSCIDHQLARILMIATEGNKTAKSEGCDQAAKEILDAIQSLIGKLRISGKATEYLITNYKKKLLLPAKTRWAYHFHVVKRLLELKDGIRRLIDEEIVEDVQNLTPVQWRSAKAFQDILEPFSTAITDLEGDQYVTLSRVIPFLVNIKMSLADPIRTGNLVSFAQKLGRLMDTRFRFIFDFRHVDFEPLYAMATFLDPRLIRTFDGADFEGNCDIWGLRNLRQLRRTAVSELEHQLHRYDDLAESHPETNPNAQTDDDGLSSFPYLKSKIGGGQSGVAGTINDQNNAKIKKEIDYYLEIAKEKIEAKTALEFWLTQIEKLPRLSKFATTVLAVPATTAPVERLFSQARYSLDNNRHRINDASLERELIIRVNKCFLDI